ncbi:tyrosine-protein phosphatase [Ectobacillus panaciterrae]|uniref:tyrosine-protein phosphatase n=1 Tax=Ectobacillus panaciterrae TaxID=363872 RepID=UPI0004279A84|nr:tyrosine-protein phosphatase [Ectobacillus panaciterrae]
MKNLEKELLRQFDGLYNFRDIGGGETLNGRKMKTGILFRSDELSRLSQKDLEKIKLLNIKSICDLRTPREQRSKPSRIKSEHGIQLINISIHDKSQEFTHLEFFKFLVGKSSTIDFKKIMKDLYYNMAFTSSIQINEVVTLLSEQKNLPALIHCTGGKDRTGFISAVIQLLVGVPYQTVLDDYLFSNELIAPRMKKVEKFIRWMSLFQISPDRIKPMLEVRREYLDEIYNDIMEKYGTVEDYLCQACNVQQSSLENLKHLLLE